VLAVQMQRLRANDVNWADLFRLQAETVLRTGIEGVPVPSSVFVATDDLTSGARSLLSGSASRCGDGGTPGSLHGSGSRQALPSGQQLSTTETTIKVSRSSRRGRHRGHGDSQEVGSRSLTIPNNEPDREDLDHPDHDPGERRRSRSGRRARPVQEQIAIRSTSTVDGRRT
jgi:hypothetical protein